MLLPFAGGELDLIWSEGAICNIGFENDLFQPLLLQLALEVGLHGGQLQGGGMKDTSTSRPGVAGSPDTR